MQLRYITFSKAVKKMAAGACMVAFMSGLASCESVYEDQGDCDPHYYLSFKFEKHLNYGDAFNEEVNSVDVYLFHPETGEYIAHFSEKGEPLRQKGYRMELPINPGDYDIITWCGLADNENHFTVPERVALHEELKCRMDRENDGTFNYSERNLHSLYHGRVAASYPDREGEHEATVYLTKDTNNLTILFHHNSGEIDPTIFDITLTDANGHLAHDNSLLSDDMIQYRPFRLEGGLTDFESRADGSEEGTGFFLGELSTSRLMADRSPVLSVTDRTNGNVLFSIPFVKYELMSRPGKYQEMDEQEYLDRKSEYSLMVFLENDPETDGWRAVGIEINSWHVIVNGDNEDIDI